MLYSTWQIMVKKKMQNTCENLFRAFADRSISLPVPLCSYSFAPGPVNDFQVFRRALWNTAKLEFFMRRREKTVAPRPEAGNRMLYSIRRRLTRDIPSFFQILALQGAGNTLYST